MLAHEIMNIEFRHPYDNNKNLNVTIHTNKFEILGFQTPSQRIIVNELVKIVQLTHTLAPNDTIVVSNNSITIKNNDHSSLENMLSIKIGYMLRGFTGYNITSFYTYKGE